MTALFKAGDIVKIQDEFVDEPWYDDRKRVVIGFRKNMLLVLPAFTDGKNEILPSGVFIVTPEIKNDIIFEIGDSVKINDRFATRSWYDTTIRYVVNFENGMILVTPAFNNTTNEMNPNNLVLVKRGKRHLEKFYNEEA